MRPWRLRVLGLALAVCVSGSPPLHAQPPVASSGPTRVLFIGNSYTHFNNLPGMFRALAEAAGAGQVEVGMAAFGGGRLVDHWERGSARDVLRQGAWDVVVLQEQSTLGVNHVVGGQPRVGGDEVFAPAAERWAAEIKRAGARPVFFLTWARRATPQDQALLTEAYQRAARRAGAQVAPVGIAWEQVCTRAPQIELFVEDGSHPSPAGTYLAACTMVATIFGRNPEGLPGKVTGPPANAGTGQVEPGLTVVLADVPPAHARQLQAAAWKAAQAVIPASGGRGARAPGGVRPGG